MRSHHTRRSCWSRARNRSFAVVLFSSFLFRCFYFSLCRSEEFLKSSQIAVSVSFCSLQFFSLEGEKGTVFVLFRVVSFHRSFVLLLLLLLQSFSNPPLLSPQPYHGRDPLPAPALVARVRGADRGEAVVAVRVAAGERGEGRAGRRGTAGAASNRGVLFSSSFLCVRLCCFGSTSSSRSSSRSTSSSSSSSRRRRRRGKGTRRQRDDPRDRPPRPGQQPPVQQRQHCQDQLRELPPDQLPVEVVERERSRGRRVDGLEPGSQRGFEQRAGAGPLREEEDGVGEGG